MKTLILYAFHQFNVRVKYFIDHAIFKDDNFDFIIIYNDPGALHKQLFMQPRTHKLRTNTIDLAVPDYVTVIHRDNIGYDFGAWSEGLLAGDRYKQYDSFIFLNSSVMGPYLPDGYAKQWPYRFLDGLKENVKLFGSTINALGDPRSAIHVQSFAFCTNKEGLEHLISKSIFSLTDFAKTFTDAIYKREIRMSREIIAAGWNIGSLMKHYDVVDFTFTTRSPESYNIRWYMDIMDPNGLDRKEVMFVKGNRGFAII